jgi:hypothetical protein
MSFASEAGHWYKRDNSPFYTIIGANGKERPTTLRDARKVGAGPGVSDIIKCAAAHALENWKDDRLLEAADANPRLPGELIAEYCRRVKALQREEAAKAPDLGSHIHGCIEKHLIGVSYDQAYTAHVAGALACVDGWCGLDGLLPERSFYHSAGFGGKCDLHKPLFVADFKSKDFTEALLPLAWDNHAQQLSAYREGLGMPDARCAIIYVSTTVPGLTHLVEVSEDELVRGWEMFKALLRFWQVKNKYEPEGT